MEASGAIGTLILILTGLTTYKGFRDYTYFEAYKFQVDPVLIDNEYGRLISSGFLHTSWLHFGFNMIALLSFSFSLEILFGYWQFLGLYFLSMLGGSLLALFIHRNHGNYSAVGASGAISGVILSSAILFPESSIGFVIIPIEIKSWIFAMLFIAISIFGIKGQRGNIGHEAHLGGALTGIILTVAYRPSVLSSQLWIVLLTLIPILAFLILIIRNPAVLMVDKYWGEMLRKERFKLRNVENKDHLKVVSKAEKEETLNRLLDKIRKDGIDSLSKKEIELLERLKEEL
jgi:membrane associated rhomboid family serine protease